MGGTRHGVKSLFLLIFRGSGFGQLTGPRERDVARARRMGGRAEKLSTRDREFTYVDSTNNVCPLPWQKVAAATKNRAKLIRLSVKKCAPLGEILPKNQGLSPIRKSFTRLAAATTNAANRVGHAIASGGLTASSN